MTESDVLKKLIFISEELEKAIKEQERLDCRQVTKVAKGLKQCKDIKKIGRSWIPVNPIELEISPFFLKVQKESDEMKIKSVFRYSEELLKELNKISSLLQFKFSGLSFIGRFIRNNGKCIITVSWRLKCFYQ